MKHISAKIWIGFGFQINEKSIVEAIDSKKLILRKDFRLLKHGFYNGKAKCFICLKESCKVLSDRNNSSILDNHADYNILWDKEISSYADKLGIKNPKVSWILGCEIW